MMEIPGFSTESFLKFAADPNSTHAVFDLQKALIAAPNRAAMTEWALKSVTDDRSFIELFERKYIPEFPTTEALAANAPGTLGRAVADHLISNGISLDFAGVDTSVLYKQEMSPLMYLGVRAIRNHDVWHAVLDLGVTPQDEYRLASFQLGQFYSPNHMMIVAAGYVHTSFYEPENIPSFLDQNAKYFALGKNAMFFPGFAFEEHWATPMSDVRQLLGISADS